MIYDKVQKSKSHDRYIVSDGTNWGVVDSCGVPIIPLKYTRITTSQDKFFRVYGEVYPNYFDMMFAPKYQSIFDYDGKELNTPEPFNKHIVIKGNGLLLGYARAYQNQEGWHAAYADYASGKVITFDDDVHAINVNKFMPDIIMVILNKTRHKHKIVKILDIPNIDKGLQDPKDVWDSVEEFNLSDEKSITHMVEKYNIQGVTGSKLRALATQLEQLGLKGLTADDTPNNYVAVLRGEAYILNEDYQPMPVWMTDGKTKWDSIYA